MELQDLLKLQIPPSPVKERTFFDIAKFPHRENVISNWYAYYFDVDELHGLGDLFIEALLSVIKKKFSREFFISNFYVCREVVTPKGNRIDLVLYGTGYDQGKQIIIENKVFFWLHNDLADYWTHKPTDQDKKLAIVLSLKKEIIQEDLKEKFYNILHSELIREVQSLVNLQALEEKQRLYFSDFITAINNLTKNVNMNEQVQFFINNTEIINKAVATHKAAFDYIISQITFATDELGLTISGNSDRYRWLLLPTEKRVYYTIYFEDLLTIKKSLKIILELNAEGLKKADVLDKTLVDKITLAGLKHRTLNKSPNFIHYATKEFELSNDDFKNLGAFISEKICTHYLLIMNGILSELNKQ